MFNLLMQYYFLYSDEIILAVVACGIDRLQETLVMIKSAIFFCLKVELRVVVVADTDLIKGFEEKVRSHIYFLY